MANKKTASMPQKKEDYAKVLMLAFNEASKITASLVFFPIALLLLGVFVDRKFETTPLFILIGMISGIAIGIYQATRLKSKYPNKK